MKKPITITLAGKDYEISTLILLQHRTISVLVAQSNAIKKFDDPGEGEIRGYQHFVDIVVAGLSRDFPEMTSEFLFKLEMSLAEIITAAKAILKFAGYVTRGEAKAATSSIGDGSTAI